MQTLQVNSVTLMKQCNQIFGGRACSTREDRGDKRPLATPIWHRCSVWLSDRDGWKHAAEHVCRRCKAAHAIDDHDRQER